MEGAPKKRSRWQFSLRFLLAAMFVFCVLLGAFMWRYRRAQAQARSIQELRSLGCGVVYDFEIRYDQNDYGWSIREKSTSPISEPALSLLGTDFFHEASAIFATDLHSGHPNSPDEIAKLWKTVAEFPGIQLLECNGYWCTPSEFEVVAGKESLRSFSFSGYGFGSSHLETIGSMPNLQHVYLKLLDSDIEDRSLKKITQLKHLRSVYLLPGPEGVFSDIHITDLGIKTLCRCSELETVVLRLKGLTNSSAKEIAKLPNLRCVDLSNSQLSDDGVMQFRSSLKLEEIEADRTGVSGPGFLHLRDLPKLRKVSLERTPLGDEDLQYLNVLRHLEILNLDGTGVSDKGLLQHGLPQSLSQIALDDTPITDASLQVLAKCRSLKKIELRFTKTTPKGIAELQKALPGCEILID